ncbi:MAG: hypothetical protein AB1646_03785 [Thermodesulfobacteriota bacterium]
MPSRLYTQRMDDLIILFAVLFGFYVAECVFRLPPGSVAFVRVWGARWKVARSEDAVGGRLVLSHPLPFFSETYVCEPSPVALSPWGVSGERSITYDEIRCVEVHEETVLVNDSSFAVCGSSTKARWVAGLLDELRQLPPDAREARIRQTLRESFGSAAADSLLRGHGVRGRIPTSRKTLRWLCNLLFLHIFLVSPAVMWAFGVAPVMVIFLASVMCGMSVAVSIVYYRAHKRWFPAEGNARVTHLMTMLLFPPAAVRAADVLGRDLLFRYEPVAVAAVLAERSEFESMARFRLLDLLHPIEQRSEAEQWYGNASEQALAEFLASVGIKESALLVAPESWDEGCVSYCPRCLVQYVIPEGTCADCPGIALVRQPDQGEGV